MPAAMPKLGAPGVPRSGSKDGNSPRVLGSGGSPGVAAQGTGPLLGARQLPKLSANQSPRKEPLPNALTFDRYNHWVQTPRAVAVSAHSPRHAHAGGSRAQTAGAVLNLGCGTDQGAAGADRSKKIARGNSAEGVLDLPDAGTDLSELSKIRNEGGAAQDGAKGSEEMLENAAPDKIWPSVVLPAVRWIYGWVDLQLQAVDHPIPQMVNEEYGATLKELTAKLTRAMGAQPDRLAASIWRSLVALMQHFVGRLAPLISRVRRAEVAATKAKELESAARDELEREIQVGDELRRRVETLERELATRSGSSALEIALPDASMSSAYTRAAVQRPPSSMPEQDIRRRSQPEAAQAKSRASSASSSKEAKELQDKVMELQSDLIQERQAKASLEVALNDAHMFDVARNLPSSRRDAEMQLISQFSEKKQLLDGAVCTSARISDPAAHSGAVRAIDGAATPESAQERRLREELATLSAVLVAERARRKRLELLCAKVEESVGSAVIRHLEQSMQGQHNL